MELLKKMNLQQKFLSSCTAIDSINCIICTSFFFSKTGDIKLTYLLSTGRDTFLFLISFINCLSYCGPYMQCVLCSADTASKM